MKVRHSWHKILYLWRDLLFVFFTLCIAFLLRVWDLSQQQYREDDANLRNLVLRLLQTGLWPVHGMHSSLGLPNGPFQVLLLLPVALVSTKPPVLTLTVAMLNVAACFLLYAFARDAWGRGVASLALLFASINPWAVVLSRRLWGDDMLAPFAVLTAWMFYRWRFRGDTRALVIAAISLAIACQVYIVGLELLVPAAILLISGFRSLWRVSTLVAGITFAALMFPYTQAALLPHLSTLVLQL
jgi:4-amino-4-deoxy-L-arabinose transferase-like glycosyltransferase